MAPRYEPEDVLSDLLYLRKGVGFTSERLAARPALVSVLGGRAEPAAVLRERLESAIQSLHDEDADLLMDVFGLSAATAGLPSLGQRRDCAGRRLGLKREAIADRDAAAVGRLLTQLLTGWYPKSPMGIRVPESHNGFVQHAVSVQTVVRDRRHFETRHHYRLVALFDGVEYLAVSAAGWATPEVLGANFRVRTVPTEHGQSHQFWHAAPMRRGQTYDLRFRVPNPDPDDPYWLTEESMAFHEPTRFASFEVVFLGEVPSMVWRVEGLTGLERPGVPTSGNCLDLAGGPSVTAQFRDVFGGLFLGIAWEW